MGVQDEKSTAVTETVTLFGDKKNGRETQNYKIWISIAAVESLERYTQTWVPNIGKKNVRETPRPAVHTHTHTVYIHTRVTRAAAGTRTRAMSPRIYKWAYDIILSSCTLYCTVRRIDNVFKENILFYFFFNVIVATIPRAYLYICVCAYTHAGRSAAVAFKEYHSYERTYKHNNINTYARVCV